MGATIVVVVVMECGCAVKVCVAEREEGRMKEKVTMK